MVRKGLVMETVKVGIREFRDNLSSYLLESEKPVAITRHGDTVGYYLPARRKRSDAERAAFTAAAERWLKVMAEAGITEDEAIEDFQQWRKAQRK
jgi:PHD/YefM family antitoxin component YafN of YafNO toxin-antitoxin module